MASVCVGVMRRDCVPVSGKVYERVGLLSESDHVKDTVGVRLGVEVPVASSEGEAPVTDKLGVRDSVGDAERETDSVMEVLRVLLGVRSTVAVLRVGDRDLLAVASIVDVLDCESLSVKLGVLV